MYTFLLLHIRFYSWTFNVKLLKTLGYITVIINKSILLAYRAFVHSSIFPRNTSKSRKCVRAEVYMGGCNST